MIEMRDHPPIFKPGSRNQQEYLEECKSEGRPYIAIHRHGQQYQIVYNIEWIGELGEITYERLKNLFNDVRETVWKQVGDTRKVEVEARVTRKHGYLKGLHRDEALNIASIVEKTHLSNIEMRIEKK